MQLGANYEQKIHTDENPNATFEEQGAEAECWEQKQGTALAHAHSTI